MMQPREVIARAIAEAEACHPDDWRHFTEQADAALSDLEAAGMAIVPVEATEERVRAALIAIDKEYDELYHMEDLLAFASAMIAAAKDHTDG